MFPTISFLSQHSSAIFQTLSSLIRMISQSSASDIAIVNEPRLMSQEEHARSRVRVDQCVS